jgi:hypothetical protein
MDEIGFREQGRYFVHLDIVFFIEFPPGPLIVGTEPITNIDEITLQTGTLRILSPTDCVKAAL